ncbi:MarR family winged helix-turn-helix transcriptional regulator [Brachybacterium phenoliresistens]|uniref:MarR family winged helix-turn-helix transcriptional regulator n=1 Tax=Brachybacterium phenoliresistens TaxID=396014 RepID=UPI0031D24368
MSNQTSPRPSAPRESAEQDRADEIMEAWRRERPDLDPASVGIVTRIWHLAKVLGDHRRRLLAAQGLDPAMMDLLGALRRSGTPHALSTRALAAREGVTPAAISQRIARAEGLGWITRSPGRSRSVIVTLTPQGQEVVDRTAGAIFAQDDELLSGLPEGRREELAAHLRALCLELDPGTPLEHVGREHPDQD